LAQARTGLIELRTFGTLDLRGSDGREFRAVLAQPKRLALLAYLAAAAPGGPRASTFHRRDTLLALFWPDQDVTRARAALSRAVHYLRASLGEGVVLSLGDEELGVDPDRISCDATQFRKELSKGRLAEALELYRGDFVEGFFLSDLPELDRWIESERHRFRDSAAGAARSLSKSAELSGDLAMALHWARQASSYAPYDEPDARRVLLLLGRLGDRGSALEFFERFARRLRSDLELDPSPETVAALNAISTARPERTAASTTRISSTTTPGETTANVPPPLNAAPTSATVASGNGRSRWRVATLAALTGLILAAALVWTEFHKSAGAENPPSIAAEKPPSIAVLPLANLGADTSAQYFSDGMTDELIATLSQVEGLRVAARTSSFVYKNRNVPLTEIARSLNVDAVLEGSAWREGSRVRITLQLVRAPEGYSIWSKTYEREVHDVFALQQDIGRDVAGALKVQLVPNKGPVSGRTTDPETYDLYLWGRYYWNTRTRDGLLKATGFFQRAIARDSSYAPAYTGLADSYNILVTYDEQPRPREIMPKAKAAALRALELDSTESEAHAALAYVATWYDWDWKTADLHFRRALELNPSNATAHHWYSIYLMATGHVTQSLAEINTARELDPASLFLRGADGVRHFMAHDFSGAVQLMQPALEVGPNTIPALPWLGLAYVRLGRVQDAIAVLEPTSRQADVRAGVQAVLAVAYVAVGRQADARALLHALETRAKREYYPRTWLVRVYAALGDKDRALTWLETAYDERDGWLTTANVDPSFDALRGEPRFRAILAKIRLQK
jgi:TolB-like protein/DNA-binding SARP family transcriptional activator/Flp pilus assembly protein TadD